MSLELCQTHEKHSTDHYTGWQIWVKSTGLGVRKGLPSSQKFVVVDSVGKKFGFKSLNEFEVYKQQMIQSGRKFK